MKHPGWGKIKLFLSFDKLKDARILSNLFVSTDSAVRGELVEP
jgi:hypothetical protein